MAAALPWDISSGQGTFEAVAPSEAKTPGHGHFLEPGKGFGLILSMGR